MIKIRHLVKNDRGSFAIEATLVFPIVFLVTALLLFLSLWSFEQANLQQKSAVMADRLAFNWENSYKDYMTGAFAIHLQDSLYWRITNDSVGQTTTLEVPEDLETEGQTLPFLKLLKSTRSLSTSSKGKLTFQNKLFERRVQVQLSKLVLPLPFLSQIIGTTKSLEAQSTAIISEPVEFIRNTDMAATYSSLLKESLADSQNTGSGTVDSPDDPIALDIQSEAEASAYLRKLVHGHSTVFDTDETGEARKIDALDPDGIAHEAKYTVNQKQAHQEILKDVELIRKGLIKGSVWHFFRVMKTGQPALTAALRKDLEEHGILIVVHN